MGANLYRSSLVLKRSSKSEGATIILDTVRYAAKLAVKKPVVVELFNLMLKLTFQFYFFTCVGSKRDKAEKDDKFTVEILKTSDGHLSPKSKYFYETVNSFNTKRATNSQQ